MLRFFRYLLVWFVATVACSVGLVPTFGTFAIRGVSRQKVNPLAMGIGALFAALAANWRGNSADFGQTQDRLLPILGVAEAGGPWWEASWIPSLSLGWASPGP